MPVQTYANHTHRPVPTLVAAAFVLAALAGFSLWLFDVRPKQTLALALFGLLGATLVLVSISRLYVTRLQDRIIRLEMRIRAREILTPAQQDALSRLDSKQIAALRFASDAELPALVERTLRDRLRPDAIKRAVVDWVPDLDRT
jgi:hypothetical protein